MSEQSIKVITPLAAWDILQSDPNATLLDVRTSVEYGYVGHPVDAINIPWQEAPDWVIDPDFTEKVRKSLVARYGSDVEIEAMPVLAICRSGKRSLDAVVELAQHGFRDVYNIEEGFEGDKDENKHRNTINGWRYHNLPWEQS